MFKRSVLLTISSILMMIVAGILIIGVIITIFAHGLMSFRIPGSAGDLISGFLKSAAGDIVMIVLLLGAGIAGVASKNKNVLWPFAIANITYMIIMYILDPPETLSIMKALPDFGLQILYIIGVALSKEK